MLSRISLLITAAIIVPTAAFPAPSWRDFKDVSNSSFVEPDGDRSLQLSIDVPASPKAVFDAFTTTEGFSSWAVPWPMSISASAA